MQRKGDLLDTEIQKLQKQDKGLENTLLLLKQTNLNSMDSLKRVSYKDEDYQKKLETEEEIKKIDTIISRRIQELSAATQTAREKQNDLASVTNHYKEVKTKLDHLIETKEASEKEISEKLGSLNTKSILREKVEKDLANKSKSKNSVEMKNVKFYKEKSMNEDILYYLQQIVESDTDNNMAGTFKRLINEKSLAVKRREPPQSARSLTASIRSSTSAGSVQN